MFNEQSAQAGRCHKYSLDQQAQATEQRLRKFRSVAYEYLTQGGKASTDNLERMAADYGERSEPEVSPSFMRATGSVRRRDSFSKSAVVPPQRHGSVSGRRVAPPLRRGTTVGPAVALAPAAAPARRGSVVSERRGSVSSERSAKKAVQPPPRSSSRGSSRGSFGQAGRFVAGLTTLRQQHSSMAHLLGFPASSTRLPKWAHPGSWR
jgi:hypothetical protein